MRWGLKLLGFSDRHEAVTQMKIVTRTAGKYGVLLGVGSIQLNFGKGGLARTYLPKVEYPMRITNVPELSIVTLLLFAACDSSISPPEVPTSDLGLLDGITVVDNDAAVVDSAPFPEMSIAKPDLNTPLPDLLFDIPAVSIDTLLPDTVCQPKCGTSVCGLDPVCGQSCGKCAANFGCDSQGQCQPLGWLVTGAEKGNENILSAVADKSGNIYVTGTYSNAVTLGQFTLKDHGGGTDILIAKLDPDGKFLWATSAGGTGGDMGADLVLDTTGNVYVVGSFSDTAEFGTLPVLKSKGAADIFVAALDVNGDFIWAVPAGSPVESPYSGNDFGWGISRDGTGSLYITGNYAGVADFGPIKKTPKGTAEAYVARLDSATGTFIWVTSTQGSKHTYSAAITCDQTISCYITGTYGGDTTFGNETVLVGASATTDIFVAQINQQGAFKWVRNAGGASDGAGVDIVADGNTAIYVTGGFVGVAEFGTYSFNGGGQSSEVFVLKMSPNGDVDWAASGGGLGSDLGKGIGLGQGGKIFVTGQFEDFAKFDSIVLLPNNGGSTDIFQLVLDSSGAFVFGDYAGGLSSEEAGNSIITDKNGNLITVGYFSDKATFGNITHTAVGGRDFFISKRSIP
jgi:hypothetical protein